MENSIMQTTGRPIKTPSHSLDKLPPLNQTQKKIAAQKLIISGYSARKAAKILKIDTQSAINYSRMPTVTEDKEFSMIFDEAIKEKRQIGLNSVLERMQELIPNEEKLDQLVKAGQFLENKPEQTTSPAFTINIKSLDISSETHEPTSPIEATVIEGEELSQR